MLLLNCLKQMEEIQEETQFLKGVAFRNQDNKEELLFQKVLNLYLTQIQDKKLEDNLKYFKFSQNLVKILHK
jgi:hypothetical protein